MVLNGPGTHWTLISNIDRNKIFYFDSYGTIPNSPTYNFMMKAKKPIQYSQIDYQSMTSTACGYYCVYVARRLLCGEKIEDILDDFSYDTHDNERILKDVFIKGKDKYGHYYQTADCPKCYYHPDSKHSRASAIKQCENYANMKFKS